MSDITPESIREEERSELFEYRVFAAFLLVCMVIAIDASVSWIWYYTALFSIGMAAHFVGYCRCYPIIFETVMKDHEMRHSADYRMTDGHLLALIGSIFWPLLWLGRTIWRQMRHL